MILDEEQQKFAFHLSNLWGDSFEQGVYVALYDSYTGVQHVPVLPSGDGGIDILISNLTVAYCCYGLMPETKRSKERSELRADIIEKFKSDLMRICELEPSGRANYSHKVNNELVNVLPSGGKLKTIRLITNYVDNQIIGKINTIFNLLKGASQKKYVEDHCVLEVLTTEAFTLTCTINPSCILKLKTPQLRTITEEVEAEAQNTSVESTKFDSKFQYLIDNAILAEDEVNEIKEGLKLSWKKALTMMEKFESNLPEVHRELEKIVKRCATKAKLDSQMPSNPSEAIEKYELLLKSELHSRLKDQLPADILNDLADFHTAKLIGDCPIDWKKNEPT